jgi:hypothetical protein
MKVRVAQLVLYSACAASGLIVALSACGGGSSPTALRTVKSASTVTSSRAITIGVRSSERTQTTEAQETQTANRSARKEFCWPSVRLSAVRLSAVRLPATTLSATHIPATVIPRSCIGGTCTPAQTIPAQNIPGQTIAGVDIPARTIQAQTIRGGCLPVSPGFSPEETTVRVSHYGQIDPQFDQALSNDYWSSGGAVSVPDVTAPGFGELNAAGFPKNQYVRPYVRSNGTLVSGYWRNSPADGLPTCRIIAC